MLSFNSQVEDDEPKGDSKNNKVNEIGVKPWEGSSVLEPVEERAAIK